MKIFTILRKKPKNELLTLKFKQRTNTIQILWIVKKLGAL